MQLFWKAEAAPAPLATFTAWPDSTAFPSVGDKPFPRPHGSLYTAGKIIIDRPVHRDDPIPIDHLPGSASTLTDPDKPCAASGTQNPDYTPW